MNLKAYGYVFFIAKMSLTVLCLIKNVKKNISNLKVFVVDFLKKIILRMLILSLGDEQIYDYFSR